MGTNTKPLVHRTAKKSWWNGRITARCGYSAQVGTYETDTWRLFKLPGRPCPSCERIKKEGTR